MLQPKEISQEVNLKSRRLGAVNVPVELTPDTPGGPPNSFDQALRLVFGDGYSPRNARWLARHAIAAVSKAILQAGQVYFPVEAVLVHDDARGGAMTGETRRRHAKRLECWAKHSGESIEAVAARYDTAAVRIQKKLGQKIIEVDFGRRG